ncbi:type i restriction-modification system specificity subunit [Levilactobacillus paucivorans]|uniref:Type i restriction-modification system specificity subunit n=1 Tax=Levilactobacillus paucivorans TaxID=616990 RepID=A0A0R2LQM0_9LACO|nr:restriction endonuclease subunit S [Levilactobacillus paucivorans]KRO04046.1 type i restriction-modification system specificity subunit [Levilactobacillus paucivorans]
MISHRTESKDQAPSRAQRLAQKGDVFYQTVRPYQMNNYLYDLPYDNYVFSTGYAQMRPNIDSYFLLNSVQNKQFVQHVLDRSTGTSYPAINSSDLSNIEIHVPSKLSEQQKIGAFFQSIDDTIALHQRKLDLLKEQKKGYLQKMFPKNGAKVPESRFAGFADDWEQRKLGAITDSFSGGTPTAGKAEYYGGEIPFIRSGEISSDSTELFITDAGLNNSSAKMVGIGDILYALYGATSGETSISRINGAINQAILAIRPTKGDDPYMIVQWLKKQKETIISTYLQGGQGNLSGSIVKDLLITLPKNKDEQAKVGSFFKKLDQTITLQQRKLDLLKEQKKGFLQKMFV